MIELDPIKYELFYHRLQQAITEAKETVRYLAASAIIREGGEVAQGFFLPKGECVVLASGMVMHIQSITRAIAYMMENRYGEDIGIYEGDQFINNDAHIGGLHNCDMILMSPIFYDGIHVGWTGNFTHVAEIGAIEPGGMCPSAREFYHEGICLPCVKLVERGKVKRDIMHMMARAVRAPREIEIDTRAKIAGNERARKKIGEIIGEFGLDFFLSAAERLVKDAEEGAKTKVKGLKPGIYRSRMFIDNTGQEERLGIIELEMEATQEGELIFRIPLISPQRKSFNNLALPGTEAALFAVLMTQLFYQGRWNSGTMKMVTLNIPRGSTLNVEESAAIGYGVVGVGLQLIGCLNDAISRALYIAGRYEDMMAPGPVFNCAFYGGRDQFGRRCAGLTLDCCCSGSGARFDRDGLDSSGIQLNPWSEAPDIEAHEMRSPMLALSRKYTPDSGGFGKYRGGNGVENIYLIHNTKELILGCMGSGGKAAGLQGLYGGYPEAITRFTIVKGTNLSYKDNSLTLGMADLVNTQKENLSPSSPAMPITEGDLFALDQWGGAGLGDPIERDPKLVLKDLERKMTTFRAAKEVYCVAIDPETYEIDHRETERLREEKRRERLKKGISAREYIKQMAEKRKNKDLPKPVLDFLDEMMEYSEEFRKRVEQEELEVMSKVS